MYQIAFVGYNVAGKMLSDDIEAVREVLREKNIDMKLEMVAWDGEIDWESYDLIYIDSTWDYHLKSEQFSAWLDEIEKLDIPVFNPPELIRWNMHKSYLFELQRKGFRIPRSQIIYKNSDQVVSLEEIKQYFPQDRYSKLVIKPAISASAHNTHVVSNPPSDEEQKVIIKLLDNSDILIQEFVEQIQEGEYSLIFIQGSFVHSVLKRPAEHDYRSQEEYGASIVQKMPPPKLIDRADRILDELPIYPLYARVDMVNDGISGLLMECELIEPYLFLGTSKRAAEALANAFITQIVSQ